MSLEALAALLGHKTLSMTLVYARIAGRTVADEYFAVSERVEALYDTAAALPAKAEGKKMAKLRNEMHRRMLGNGYCARRSTSTVTSSRSANRALSSSPPSTSNRRWSVSATTPRRKDKLVASGSSISFWGVWNRTLRDACSRATEVGCQGSRLRATRRRGIEGPRSTMSSWTR
jgi:hypothetical protein